MSPKVARSAVVVALVVISLGLAGVALASRVAPRRASLPTPGTPSQVAALVAASSKIEKLPATLLPPLQDVAYDNAANYYPVVRKGCAGTTTCVFGDKSSTTTVALFGDSHAAMWLPALVYDGDHLKLRVVLLWFSGCPAADLTVWNQTEHSVDKGCDAWRAQSIADLRALAPSLVLLSDRTADVDGPKDKAIPGATWRAGMEQTIASLQTAKTKVAVIGDVTALTNDPSQCLAAHPDKIQDCSSPNPNKGYGTHVADEMAAAKAKDSPYVNPQSWLCTRTCSPVVGTLDVYYDSLHASATYAEYLSLDFEVVLKALLA